MENLSDFDQLWDYQNPAATEEAFRGLLPMAETSGDRSYYLQLLTQIARTLGLQRKFEEAHSVLNKVEILIKEDHKTAKIRLMLERGRIYNSAGDKTKAKPLFVEAWTYGKANGLDYFAVDAAHMMGFIFAGIGNANEKLAWEEKALACAERSESEKAKKWLGSLYNNIGWSYHEIADYQKAKSMFEKCLEWQETNGKTRGAKIARWAIAKMLRLMGDSEEALGRQLALLEAEGGEDKSGYTFEEIAECHFGLGQSEEAKTFFSKAYTTLSKDAWLVENEPERIERLKTLGNS